MLSNLWIDGVSRRRRAIRVVLVGAAVAIAFGALAARSWAPPVEGFPDIRSLRACVPYGSSIPVSGFGFRAGARIALSTPQGHYELPGFDPTVEQKTVRADADGTFRARLAVRLVAPRIGPLFTAVVVSGEGPSGADGRERSSFDQVVLTTRRSCHMLNHPRDYRRVTPTQRRHAHASG